MTAKPIVDRPSNDDDLRAAIRSARAEYAERDDALSALRGAEVARLEVLEDALRPVVAQAPHGVDLFDLGMTHGEKPRLFVDTVAFFELGRDRRTYAFFQDTRGGRMKLAQSDDVSAMTRAATQYVARRLVERERALAADADPIPVEASAGLARTPRAAVPAATEVAAPGRKGKARGRASRALEFVVDFLGAAALAAIVVVGVWQMWKHGTEWFAPIVERLRR